MVKLLTPTRLRCQGREGDFVTYLATATSRPEPYTVTLDLTEHTSRCDCEAGHIGRYLCKHQRAAITDWYTRRAHSLVSGDSDAELDARALRCIHDLADYTTKCAQARQAGNHERAVLFDGYALRCRIMIDATGDEAGERAEFPILQKAI